MVLGTVNSSKTHRVVQALESYCVVRRGQRIAVKPYQAWSLQVWEVLQLLAFLLPAEEQQLPWAYHLTGTALKGLAFIVRPDYLLQTLGCSTNLVALLYASAVFLKIGTMGVMILAYGLMDAQRSELVAISGFKGLIGRIAYIWDCVLSLFLLNLLLIPGVPLLAKEAGSDAISAIGLLTVLVLAVFEQCYLGTLLWNESSIEASCSTYPHTISLSVILATLLARTSLPYRDFPVHYSAIQLVSGLFLVYQALLVRPYYRVTMNAVLLGKGVMLSSGGLCIFLGYLQSSSQSSILAISLFSLTTPLIYYLFLHYLQRSSTLPITITPQSFVHDLQLKLQLHPTPPDLDPDFCLMFDRYPDDPQVVLLALTYYQWQKDATFVQVNLSKLQKLKWPVKLYMDCCYARFATIQWLMRSTHLAEAMTVMEFEYEYRRLLVVDRHATEAHCNLFTELTRNTPKIARVMHFACDIDRVIDIYKDSFREISQKYKQNRQLLHLFGDFYQKLTNSKQALRYSELLIKAEKQQLSRNYDEVVDYYNPETMIMAISLEKSDFGHIVWARSSGLLGYADEELQGRDHCTLIPPPISMLHMEKLRRIALFRHHHPVYANVHGIVFMHKSGELVHAYWKVRLVNAPFSDNLFVLCALKKRENAPVLAFVDDEGLRVTAMVSSMQTKGFRKQLRTLLNRSIPLRFSFTDLFGTDQSQWQAGNVCLRGAGTGALKGKVVDIRCEELNFYGLHRQKCLEIVAYFEHSPGKLIIAEESESNMEVRKVDFEDVANATETANTQSKSQGNERISVSVKSHLSVFTSFYNPNRSLQVSYQTEKTGFSDDMRKNIRIEKRKLAILFKFADCAMTVLFLWTITMFTVSLVVQFDIGQLTEELRTGIQLNGDVDSAVKAAVYSRELVEGVQGGRERAEQLAALLRNRVAELHRGELGRLEVEAKGVWWELNGHKAELIATNTAEILSKLATHLLPLSQRAKVNITDLDFLNIYRNAAHEAVISLNSTMNSLFQASSAANTSLRCTLQFMAYTGAGLLFLFGLVLDLVVWKKIRALRLTVWTLLGLLPPHIYASARATSLTRLQFTHKTDLEDHENTHFPCKPQFQLSNITYLPESKLLFAAFLLFSVLFAATIAVYFVDSDMNIEMYREKMPLYVYISGLRKVELSRIMLYLRELLSPVSAATILQNYTIPFYDIRAELAKAAANLEYFNHFLIHNLDTPFSSLSSDHFNILFQGSAGNIGDYGASSLLFSLITDLQTLDTSDQVAISCIQSTLKSLELPLASMTEMYKSQIEVQMREMAYEHMWEITLICSGMVAYYVFIVRKLIARVVRKVGAEWGILAYIPREACPEAIKILRHRS